MPDLANILYQSDADMDDAYAALGSFPPGMSTKLVRFDRKQYTFRSNVLRWIPAKWHGAIRAGTFTRDLTGCIEQALWEVYVPPVGVPRGLAGDDRGGGGP